MCYRQSRRGVARQNSEKCKTIVCIANTFTHRRFYTQKLLHTKAFTHRSFYTEAITHKAFTHRSFYIQTLLHTDVFTHRRFYTDTVTHRHVYTQTLLHTDLFTHRSCFYTQTLWHTEAFTHRRFYTQALLHTNTFTHKHFYTQTLLHTEALHTDAITHRRFYTQKFTHKQFYTQTLLHRDAFTHRSFYTQTLLHTDAFTHRRFYTHRNFTSVFGDPTSFRAKGTCERVARDKLKSQFYSVFADRASFRAKGLRGTSCNRNFTSAFDNRTSFVRNSPPETRNRNFTSVFDDRTSFRAKGCAGQVEIAILPHLNLHWYTKCVPFFFCRFQKMCPFKGLKKKGVRSSVALHSNQPGSFPKGSIGHFCHALMHVQHAKYDLEQKRLTTWVASQQM